LYLKKRPFVSIVDREDKSGIKIINDNRKIVIGFIDKRGPGAEAGLKKGDVIKSIDNRIVDGTDLLAVRDLFKGEDGKKILIYLERDEKKIETGIVLKKGFDHLFQAY
jgi:C-terminal processing protease CtpA/Prc